MDEVTQLRGRARAAWRRTRAVELAVQGHDYDTIAEQVGYANRGSAWRAVQQALAEQRADGVAQYRDMVLGRLETLLAAHWDQAVEGDVRAAETVLKIITAEARLLGLDEPGRELSLSNGGTLIVDSQSTEYREAMSLFASGIAGHRGRKGNQGGD